MVFRHQALTLLVAVGTVVLTVVLYIVIPKGFFPVQDTGLIQAVTEAPQSVSFAAMSERQRALAEAILKDPDVDSLTSFVGVDGTNPTLNSGPHADQPQAARASAALTATQIIRRLQRETSACRASRSTCSRPRTSRSIRRSAARSTSSSWKRPTPANSTPGCRA